jgi:hypothetical protein
MKQYLIIPFIVIALINNGCAGSKKMHMPLAEIDRSLVNPKGTWSVAPGVGAYISVMDTIAYRGISYFGLIQPTSSYSFTHNLQLSFATHFLGYIFPSLTWQLTKSPYVDTTMRYKWQFALNASTTIGRYMFDSFDGSIRLGWKKRLSPSVWYGGGISSDFFWNDFSFISCDASNKIGFQLSPKASVSSGIGLSYGHIFGENPYGYKRNSYGYSGSFDFQYAFSPWFTLRIGSGISGGQKSTSISLDAGGTFYW